MRFDSPAVVSISTMLVLPGVASVFQSNTMSYLVHNDPWKAAILCVAAGIGSFLGASRAEADAGAAVRIFQTAFPTFLLEALFGAAVFAFVGGSSAECGEFGIVAGLFAALASAAAMVLLWGAWYLRHQRDAV